MMLKCLTSVNCYSVLTCSVIVTLSIILLFYNSKIMLRIKEHGQDEFLSSDFSENIIENLEDINKSNIHVNGEDIFNQPASNNHKNSNNADKILHRTRRYLTFPEGSSFQLVFDLIIPIVDYTNYAIMGITCAVAWELPSKPPSEIETDFIDKLNDGTFGLSRNDSIHNIKYVDTTNARKPPKDQTSTFIYVQPSRYSYQSPSKPRKPAYYIQPPMQSHHRAEYNTYNRYNEYIPRRKQPVYYETSEKTSPFILKSINNERFDVGKQYDGLWERDYAKRPPVKASYLPPPKSQESRHHKSKYTKPKQHAVYHIMGKRSVTPKETNPRLHKLDKIHLNYHRTSRQKLYSKLEAMFHRQSRNGTECVLRALCETGKRRHETEPGNMLTEIFRAVFTLPEAYDDSQSEEYHPKHRAWDEAHWNERNCADEYPSCEDLIWNS